jgi:hypothetical protein
MGTVTIGGTSFDIYSTLPLADDYMKARLGASAWDDAASLDRDKAIVSATRMIDRENWLGQKTVTSQPLEFPRTGLTDKDGNSVLSTTVPAQVDEATYELALSLLADVTVQDKATTGTNTKRVKAGSVEVEFFQPKAGTPFPTIPNELLLPFRDGGGLVGLASGCDEASTFADSNPFGYAEGLP